MRADDVRFLFGYDRWATERVLDAWERADRGSAEASRVIGERGLTAIMVHTLGAAERWRAFFAGGPHPGRRERNPELPSPEELRRDWEAEWEHCQRWLDSLDDAAVAAVAEDPDDDPDDPINGIPNWQLMAHVVNHGTQHRSEAATILTDADASPGDLDLSEFAQQQARATAYRMAVVGIQHNPIIAAHYARKRAAGKSKMNALGHCMRKALSLVWGVWRNGHDFDPSWGSNA